MNSSTLHSTNSLQLVTCPIAGVQLVETVRREDERGFFTRTWCREEFAAAGLMESISQCNLAFNRKRGTLRGMHWQAEPDSESKVLRCIRGSLFAVALDLREDSPTFTRYASFHLDAENRRGLHVPAGCALGYQTLADDTEVFYLMSGAYVPAAARGLRYDDPAFGIAWPLKVTAISEADRTWPAFEEHAP